MNAAREGRDDGGWATAYVAVLGTALVLMAGLVIDGGRRINTYQRASDLASNAARAGAQAIDPASVYAGESPRLLAEEAQANASSFLDAAGHPGSMTGFALSEDLQTVTVTVTLTDAPLILVNLGSAEVTATASSTAIQGVDEQIGN